MLNYRRRKASPDSEEIEQTGTKCRKRNFPSVEQIQDSGSELRLESFAKVEDLKHNSELPLNASDQDKSPLRHHKKAGWGFYPNDNKFVGLNEVHPLKRTIVVGN